MLTEDILKEKLPYGSGIDGVWHIKEQKNYWKCDNAYHAMNDVGYYTGWADFTLIIPKKDTEVFKLHFNGKHSQYLNRRYGLREYLEDLFAQAIRDMIVD